MEESRIEDRLVLFFSSLFFDLVSIILSKAIFLGKKEEFEDVRSMEFLSSGQVSLYLLLVFFLTIKLRMQVSQKVWPHMVSILGGFSSLKLFLHCKQIRSSSEFID